MKTGLDILDDRAACPPRHFDGFDSLIAPIGTKRFFAEFWENRPFLIKRAQPGYFDALLSLDDMDFYLGTRTFHEPDIRIVKHGKDKPFREYAKGGVADRQAMLAAYGDGSMLLFSHLNRHHLPLAEAISQCEADLHLPFRSNVYLSPPHSQGFKLHWDTHDVMVLQIAGAKRWEIYNNPLALPHEEQQKELPARLKEAEKIAEVTLEAGDVLFLPRGFIHGAEATDSNSLHISVGMRSPSLGDVALGAFRSASLAHPDMRRVALFDQYQCPDKQAEARRLIHEIIDNLDLEAALDDVHCSFIKSRQPPSTGPLKRLAALPALDHASLLKVRPGVLYALFEKGDTCNLAVDGRVLVLPKGVAPAIRFIQDQASFSPAQLPGLEQESRLILSQTLQREGLLELA